MNILIVSQYFHPENFRINDIARECAARGHAVTVLTGLPNYPEGRLFAGYSWKGPWREEFDGVEVLRVPLVTRCSSKGLRLVFNYLTFALSACLFGVWRCRGNFDAILVFQTSPVTVGLPAILLKWLKHAPILFWVLDLWPESLQAARAISSPLILKLVGRLTRFIYRRCDLILMTSRGFARSILRWGGKQEQLRYFPNWAEKPDRPSAAGVDLPPLPKGFKILFAGNIGKAQSFETILKAAERLKEREDIHWIIVGDGREASWVENEVLTRELTGCVHLLGRYPLETMPLFFSQADALLVTLRRDPIFALTVPGKVQTYLASGRPVIAALDGEGADLIREIGAGCVCPAEDAMGLANAVLEVYGMSPEHRCEMGAKAMAYCKRNFDRSLLMDRLEAMLTDIVGAEAGKHDSNGANLDGTVQG